MVDYVNIPPQINPLDSVHVVVDRFYGAQEGSVGAVIDFDGDGVRDVGENWRADFGIDGNADLFNKSVIIHFNDIPGEALNLTGFGTDDKIQIDAGDDSWIDGFSVGANSVLFGMAHYENIGGPTTPSITTVKTGIGFKHTLLGQGSITFTADSGSGTIAYWSDSSNALNNPANLLKGYAALGGTKSYSEVLANLNSNHYPGLVEFVWPVNVVIDDQGGTVASFIDVNANGMRDDGEDTLALLGQTQADVDAFNTAAGTSYGSQIVDLATENVTIHFNDLPTGNWIPDLSGFDGNDRIEIDVNALRFGDKSQPLFMQNSYTPSTRTDNAGRTGGYIGVGTGPFSSALVYLSGSKLIFGHSSSGFYTANTSNEGTIASNAAALAGHYQQQVAFVMSGGGPE